MVWCAVRQGPMMIRWEHQDCVGRWPGRDGMNEWCGVPGAGTDGVVCRKAGTDDDMMRTSRRHRRMVPAVAETQLDSDPATPVRPTTRASIVPADSWALSDRKCIKRQGVGPNYSKKN